MSPLDLSMADELRAAVRSLAEARNRYYRVVASPVSDMQAFEAARDNLNSAVLCVVLAESSLEGKERVELEELEAKERERREAEHADALWDAER